MAAAAQGSADTVQIIGTRVPTALDRVVADVVVLDREQIRAYSADSVEDLLRRVGGIQSQRNGPIGQNAALQIRGSAATGTLVLIDGVRIGSATLGQTDLAGIDLAQVERVEIMRGPSSSLYGADAVGGVVNIVTRRGEGAPTLRADVAAGQYRAGQAHVSVGGAQSGFDYAAGLAGETSRAVSAIVPGDQFGLYNPDDDGFRRRSLTLDGGYSWVKGQRVGLNVVASRLNSRYDSAEYPPPNFVSDASPDFRSMLDSRLAALSWNSAWSARWTTSLRASYQSERLRSGANVISVYDTRRRQVTGQATWTPDAAQQLVMAVDLLDEAVSSTDYGAPSRDNSALVLGYTARFGAHKLQADLRYDHNSVYGNEPTGKLGWAYALNSAWSVRLLGGTAFRAPSFNDLYYPDYGVPTIEPEKSRSIEAGLDYRGEGSSFGATVYRNRVSQLIGYQSDPAQCPPGYHFGCAGNVSRALLQGLTLTGAQRLGELQLSATLDWLHAVDSDTGQTLPRRASHQQTLAAAWSPGAWQFGASLISVGSRPDAGVTLPSYQLLNLNVHYRVATRWQVEARLLNVADKAYEPVRDYQGLGRQFWLGLRYDGAGL